jgi:hypothetical protein
MFSQLVRTTGNLLKAIIELRGIKQVIVTGAAAATNIAVSGIRTTDVIVGAVNLTDLTNIVVTAAKALWTGAGDYNAVLEIKTVGKHGNDWAFALVGDSAEAGGVTVNVDVSAKRIVAHYESGVSTVTNVNSAITALAGIYDVVDVKTAGTGATILTTPGDDTGLVWFTGGLDADANEKPVITSNGNIQFPISTTANKKLLVTYFEIPTN